jgi:hypothetical protein
VIEARIRGVLDTPLEPVIGLASGETRWRGMTASCEAASCEAAVSKLNPSGRVGVFRCELHSRERQHPFLPVAFPCPVSDPGLSLALAQGGRPDEHIETA